ncbi:MAG: hypothetical protein AAB605_01060 [Patescibacteria group bacterium]
MSVERKRFTDEEPYPRDKIKKIVDEFYAHEKNGGVIPNEVEKAAVILSYIEHLQAKYRKQGQPMTERDIATLGFDIDALREGKLRASALHGEDEEGNESESRVA